MSGMTDQELANEYRPSMTLDVLHSWASEAAARLRGDGEQGQAVALDAYDAGLLSDFGGGNVEWWQDYIRAELGRAHDFYQSQADGLSAAPAAPAPVAGDAVGFDAWWMRTNGTPVTGSVAENAARAAWQAALAQDRASQGAAAGVPEDALRQALLTHIPRITEKKIEAVVGYTRRLAAAPVAPKRENEND